MREPKELPPDFKVYSIEAHLHFNPIDIDLERLITELGWDNKVDRFRLWLLSRTKGSPDDFIMKRSRSKFILLRKLDVERGVLIHMKIVPTLKKVKASKKIYPYYKVCILSNEDSLPYKLLNIFLNVPPSFHEELEIVKEEWTSDANQLGEFTASAIAVSKIEPKSERFIPKGDYFG
ncbi:MAG: hypothetical protein ACUVTD_05715 [Nitrososphaerales archaeon]